MKKYISLVLRHQVCGTLLHVGGGHRENVATGRPASWAWVIGRSLLSSHPWNVGSGPYAHASSHVRDVAFMWR